MSLKFVAPGVLLSLVLGGILWVYWPSALTSFPEVVTITQGARSFDELSGRFKKLAEEKGALYAFDILRRATLPPGTDIHLLGHVVGDELYKQQGIDAISSCTQEFRNACSHTIVIGALSEYGGEAALPRIRDACKMAPGGPGAYTMCYHGLGHGVFAYFGYDLEKTFAFCRKTATDEYHSREFIECAGGAVMELMGGGGHDREAWKRARSRYLSETNPLEPCTTSVVPEDAKVLCLIYITPHLFEAAGGNLAAPNERDFSGAFHMCDAISKEKPALRDACFGGIGKEFPVLSLARDVRNIANASDEQLRTIARWCALAPHEEARLSCENSVLESLFWGGENDVRLATRYCALAEGAMQGFCAGKVVSMGKMYLASGSPQRAALCDALPDAYQDDCKAKLL